jgi:hypothetical protein
MKRQNMAKWWREFEAGRSGVPDDGHPLSLMKSSKIGENFCADRRLTIDELHHNVQKCQKLFPMSRRAGRRFLRR